MSLGVAFRAFFSALANQKRSDAIRKVLEMEEADLDEGIVALAKLPAPEKRGAGKKGAEPKGAAVESVTKAAPPKPVRSDALTLLAVLQREARLVDLVQEPLDQFGDAQVGAAARPCLKQCRQALERVFELQPLVKEPENSLVEVPADASAIRYQWVGQAGSSGDQARLVHPGWIAGKCELPQWTGVAEDASVVAAAEVERAN